MAQAKEGDTVRVHYTGKLEDGTVFDTSSERAPMEFTIGEGEIIPGFEQAVIGMEPGETKTARIPPEEAYGPHRDDMTLTVDGTSSRLTSTRNRASNSRSSSRAAGWPSSPSATSQSRP